MAQPKTSEARPRDQGRLHGLDALRGLAALAVVFWHWQHFQMLAAPSTVIGPHGAAIDLTAAPLHGLFWLLYEHGGRAVDLFFVLSGFIFFHLYERAVATGQVGAARFTMLRFSRLYPLHLATLLAVAALQGAFVARTGEPFIYGCVSARCFVQNVLFFNDPSAASFNGPTWSLTVELAAYALFFVLARLGVLAGWRRVALITACAMALWVVHATWARGFAGFFAGGLAFRAYQAIQRGGHPRRAALALALAALAAWAGVVITAAAPWPWERWAQALPDGRYWAAFLTPRWLLCYGVLPLTVLTVAAWEAYAGPVFRALSRLGDITYASYLLHFPMQLALALAYAYGLVTLAALETPLLLAAFFVVLIGLSALVYAAFEMPAQAWLRRRLSPRRG